MARTKFKFQLFICVCLTLLSTVRSLPIPLSTLETTDSAYSNVLQEVTLGTEDYVKEIEIKNNIELSINRTLRSLERSILRPGQTIFNNNVRITRDGNFYNGRSVIDIRLAEGFGNQINFHLSSDIEVSAVQLGLLSEANALNAIYDHLPGSDILRINPLEPGTATSYIVIVEYRGSLRGDGLGLFLGQYDEEEYVGMNLHPSHARRVFPCLDEPNMNSNTMFTFIGFEHENIVSNSILDVNAVEGEITFQALETSSYLWGMMSHTFQAANQLVAGNVHLYARASAGDTFNYASVAITEFYTSLNEWTGLEHSQIVLNQQPILHIMALPDVSKDWYALSTVCIWEPYILNGPGASMTQSKLIFINIAEALARQWFGYAMRIMNWRYQWLSSGLTSYAAYDVLRNFLPSNNEANLNMDSIFTTDVIQESLLLDSYTNVQPLELAEDIFEENLIRQHLSGLLKYKAPAILRMARLTLGAADAETDIIQDAARLILLGRRLEYISSQVFYEALGGTQDNFISSWVTNAGYPILTVATREGELVLGQKRFGFASAPVHNYHIPITFTTATELQFDDIHATQVMIDATLTIPLQLDEDWIIMNLQGQGYYRVNYAPNLWERIILALEEPEAREEIHVLNRASIVDDAFNLARAGELDYDIALRIGLTMVNELDYAVWRAFVRNMEFIRKRLTPFVSFNPDRDDAIFSRFVTTIITLFEETFGFGPFDSVETPMNIIMRGLVMDFACRSGYDPCIAAVVDMFYDPNDNTAINPNIPSELRPAVYCTMMMDGDPSVREALINHLESVNSKYERLVILQSLACSPDTEYIQSYLDETIAEANGYTLPERLKIFEAVASSNFNNAGLAFNFLRENSEGIVNMYGGIEKLEEALRMLTDNLVTQDVYDEFSTWTNSIDALNRLGEAREVALTVQANLLENLRWNNNHMEMVYDWINANHAPTVFVSTLLITLSLFIALFNN